VPVPSAPNAIQPATPAPAPAVEGPQPPVAGTTTQAQEPSPYQVNKAPQPAPAAKKASNPAPSAPVPPAPAPKLGDVLTPDAEKQYNASIDQSLSRAQNSLNAIGGRPLNKDQRAEVEQIRNFIQQAQTARVSDPAGAKSLAERAEVLARDLAATFRH